MQHPKATACPRRTTLCRSIVRHREVTSVDRATLVPEQAGSQGKSRHAKGSAADSIQGGEPTDVFSAK